MILRHPRRHHVPRISDEPDKARVAKAKQISARSKVRCNSNKLDNFYIPAHSRAMDALVQKAERRAAGKNWKSGGYLARLPKILGQSYSTSPPG